MSSTKFHYNYYVLPCGPKNVAAVNALLFQTFGQNQLNSALSVSVFG